MKRAAAVIATLLSCFFFPWPVAVALAVISALWVPLLPLATGILLDTLAYDPHAFAFPYFALSGLVVTLGALLVRRQLSAGIIGE